MSASAAPTSASADPTASSSATAAALATRPNPQRSGSILLQQPLTSCSHVNVCRPWISWKKGPLSEYVSKPRVFFDHLHHQIVLFTGTPPSKMWLSDRSTQTWIDYPINLPSHNDIIGAQFSPDRSHVALRVSDKEVKVVNTASGEVVTARSCRGSSSRMISVHWVHDTVNIKPSTNPHAPTPLFLLFVTNAGVELYELTSDNSTKLLSSSPTTTATPASSSLVSHPIRNKLKHIKTATYTIVYHWLLMDENILLLVDSKNVFQAYKLSSKTISKIAKFELDCAGTSLNPPQFIQFHREQISLTWLYNRLVILFVNEIKGQLHLLALGSVNSQNSDTVEQTHVFDLYSPGKYDISNIDNVLVVHNTVTKVSMLFDVRSESKVALTEPLPIGPPLATTTVNYFDPDGVNKKENVTGGSETSSLVITTTSAAFTTTAAATSTGRVSVSSSSSTGRGSVSSSSSSPASIQSEPRSAPGMSSLAPASFHPYVKWTFLAPSFVWESTGDQQQGNLWTLQLNLQQIAYSWPNGKRTRLMDFLLKRTTVSAKQLILQILLQIVCTETNSLALLSRLFSLLNRMNYDHKMHMSSNPSNLLSATGSTINLANLPLLPPFSNPPSAANTAPSSQMNTQPNSTMTSPAAVMINTGKLVGMPPPSPTNQSAGGVAAGLSSAASPALLGQGQILNASRMTSPATLNTSRSSDALSPLISMNDSITSFSLPSSNGIPLSFELDDSLNVLSCEMIDVPALLAQPLTLEHNLHGYMLITQLDIFLHVFQRARQYIPIQQLIPIVVEYIRSIHRHFLHTEDILNDFLVSALFESGSYSMLHQYLQYHILNDSLPIANRLLSISHLYPPAYQLGIDMLYRLNALPRLSKVLLLHGQVLSALQLAQSYKGFFDLPGLTPRDYMRLAYESQCRITFYQVFRFFEQRNTVLRGNPTFVAGDGCEEYVHKFGEMFPTGPLTTLSLGDKKLTVVTSPPPSQQQYYNLGDDEFDVEDDDIEYHGVKPLPGGAASSTASTVSPTLSPTISPTSSDSDVSIHLPAPVDLSAELNLPACVPSTFAATSPLGAEMEEDSFADQGTGFEQSAAANNNIKPETIVESAEEQIHFDGSFNGGDASSHKSTTIS